MTMLLLAIIGIALALLSLAAQAAGVDSRPTQATRWA